MDAPIETTDQKLNNVVLFPKMKKNSPPQTIEEVRSAAASSQTEMAIDIAYVTMLHTLMDISDAGFNLNNNPDSAYDIMMCVESIKSLIMRTCNIEHPMHDVVKNVVQIDDPQEVLSQFGLMIGEDL